MSSKDLCRRIAVSPSIGVTFRERVMQDQGGLVSQRRAAILALSHTHTHVCAAPLSKTRQAHDNGPLWIALRHEAAINPTLVGMPRKDTVRCNTAGEGSV